MDDEARELDEVEQILRRQDEALALLSRLRTAEPIRPPARGPGGGGRRESRRWPAPAGVSLELHDGDGWRRVECVEIGLGGARIARLPDWADGPTPARLQVPEFPAVLVLSDVMWRDREPGTAGLRFEFLDNEERDLWADALVDVLLAEHALR